MKADEMAARIDVLEARLTLRGLTRQPGFALTVIVTLAVGIGANFAFFGYASYFLAPTIRAPEPGRVVSVHTGTREAPDGANSYLDWQDFRSGGARTFAQQGDDPLQPVGQDLDIVDGADAEAHR